MLSITAQSFAFLDTTKAFDRDNYSKLFKLLLTHNLPANVLKSFLIALLGAMSVFRGSSFCQITLLCTIESNRVVFLAQCYVYVDDLLLQRAKVFCWCPDINSPVVAP